MTDGRDDPVTPKRDVVADLEVAQAEAARLQRVVGLARERALLPAEAGED